MGNFNVSNIDENDLNKSVNFFYQEMQKVWEKFNYSPEIIENWKSWHSYNEMVNKIVDKDRFFSTIKDKNWEIIWVFESKKSWQKWENDVQIVQWTLINEKFQWVWLWSLLKYDFLLYCKQNWVKKIRTFVHKNNDKSLALNEKFWFNISDFDQEIDTYTLEKELDFKLFDLNINFKRILNN